MPICVGVWPLAVCLTTAQGASGVLSLVLGLKAALLLALVAPVAYLVWRLFLSGPSVARESGLPPRSAALVPLAASAAGRGRPIPCKSPVTGEASPDDLSLTPAEVVECVQRSRAAQAEWAKTSFAERRAVLQALLEYVLAHSTEIAVASVKDTGKTLQEAVYGEILTTCEKLRWIMAHGEECLAPESRAPPLLLFLKQAHVEYYPMGVIGVIIPWNYPFHNAASAIIASIFAGNGCVVKASEWATGSRAYYDTIFRKVLAERGHNPDLVQIIGGAGETGSALVTSGVDKVLFIGSPETGGRVAQAAATTLTPVILELGGKDPFVVFADCEYDHMLDVAVRACTINCAQNCIAAERYYIEAPLYERFVKDISARVSALRPGSLDSGSMTMPAQVAKVDDLVQDAIARGARLMTGGKRLPELGPNYYAPTVLADVTHEMRIANEETFGPCCLVFKFTTEEEVVRLANCTRYGLAASVFSLDYKRAERVARAMHSGMATVNDWALSYLIQSLPFGGVKISGYGHFNGKEGLRGFSNIKSVVNDRFSLRTQTPKFLKYPVPDHGPLIVEAAVHMIYEPTFAGKVRGLVALLRLLISPPK